MLNAPDERSDIWLRIARDETASERPCGPLRPSQARRRTSRPVRSSRLRAWGAARVARPRVRARHDGRQRASASADPGVGRDHGKEKWRMGFASRGCVRARDARTLDREKRAIDPIDPEGFFAALDTRLSRGKRRVSASNRACLLARSPHRRSLYRSATFGADDSSFSGRGSVTRPIFFLLGVGSRISRNRSIRRATKTLVAPKNKTKH